jgi:hypothetical protein
MRPKVKIFVIKAISRKLEAIEANGEKQTARNFG